MDLADAIAELAAAGVATAAPAETTRERYVHFNAPGLAPLYELVQRLSMRRHLPGDGVEQAAAQVVARCACLDTGDPSRWDRSCRIAVRGVQDSAPTGPEQ